MPCVRLREEDRLRLSEKRWKMLSLFLQKKIKRKREEKEKLATSDL